jgi:hypothetical protein
MKQEELIHVKIEYAEIIAEKGDLLSLEIDSLKIAKSIKEYGSLRQEEFNVKLKVHKRIKETGALIKKMTQILPEIQVPQFLKKKEEYSSEEVDNKIRKAKQPHNYSDIESQLKDIQERLGSLKQR